VDFLRGSEICSSLLSENFCLKAYLPEIFSVLNIASGEPGRPLVVRKPYLASGLSKSQGK